MAKKIAKVSDAVPVDLKALSQEVGATVKQGAISAARGKYYLTVGDVKTEIPVSLAIPEKDLLSLVGKPVFAASSGRSIIAIWGDVVVPKLPKCYWILCYRPAPDVFQPLQDALRGAGINELVQAGKISEAIKSKMEGAKVGVGLVV
jgi:hypothetical protein